MARAVFFSFDYGDLPRATIVRDSWVNAERQARGFTEWMEFVKMEKQGDDAVRDWIDRQFEGTSVTVVLVGDKTCYSKWVEYAIFKSIKMGSGLLGIDITKIRDLQGKTTQRCGEIPEGYKFYLWNKDDGAHKMDDWIDDAAEKAGKK